MADKLKRSINVKLESKEHYAMIACLEAKENWRAYERAWKIVDIKRAPYSDWISVEIEEVE